MSKFKKVISLVLCISLLAGSFAFLGDLITPKASAAVGESNISVTYAELDAQYDNFVYVGMEVIEVKNGEITDHYVQPGDWLEYRTYVLSDMYVGSSYPINVYERDFFDVRVVSSTTPSTSDSWEKAAYDTNIDTYFVNPDHPETAEGENGSVSITLTAVPCNTLAQYKNGWMEIDAEVYNNWDQVRTAFAIDSTIRNEALIMKTDTWLDYWYVRVQEGLGEGDTGTSQSPENIYRYNYYTNNQGKVVADTRRLADVFTADWSDTVPSASTPKSLANRIEIVDYLLLDDTVHTFTIGENPEDLEGEVEKKTATFIESDGSTISATEYAPNDAVAVPAAIANQYGWEDTSTGAVVTDLADGFAMPEKDITYKRILTTDKFDIKVNLDKGVVDASKLPADVVDNGDGTITVKAPLGTEIALADVIPADAISRPGYALDSWNPATITLTTTKGATVKAAWKADTFEAKFYLDKAAYDAGEEALGTVSIAYQANLAYADIAKVTYDPQYKFGGWVNAATGENVSTVNASTGEKTPSIGSYTYTENTEFYAAWTKYDSAIDIMVFDYEAGSGWKTLATKYNDSGKKLTLSDVKKEVEAAGYGYVNPSSSSDSMVQITTDLVFGTDTVVYVYSTLVMDVTVNVPVIDETTKELTGEYETKTLTPTARNQAIVSASISLSNTAPAGYSFVGWFDEDGNEAIYTESTGFLTISTKGGKTPVIAPKYELVEYTIEFNAKDGGNPVVFVMDGTFKLGDEIDFSTATFTNKKTGKAAILPEIGVESSMQPNGSYMMGGYSFAGWSLGFNENEISIKLDEKFVLTAETLDAYAKVDSAKLEINGSWEAEYYDLVLNYQTGVDADGNPVYTAMDPVKIQTGERIATYLEAGNVIVEENMPNGKRFVRWETEDGDASISRMPAYGLTLYATYTAERIWIYVNYNHGTEENPLTLEETMSRNNFLIVTYGQDLDVIPEGSVMSPITEIKGGTLTRTPGDNYENIGWTMYHVDSEADVYDTTKWEDGINDDGSTVAESEAIIFQVNWKAHNEFFFRVYTSDHFISRALGKDFKMYYWYNGKPASSRDGAAPINTYSDIHLLLFLSPTIENWDWSRFFDIDMWKNVTLRFDPVTISKSALNPKNWGALLEALFNGIGSGFGGSI